MAESPSLDVMPGGEDASEAIQEPGRDRASDAHQALSITRQYIKDFSFENPNAPGVFNALRDEGPELKVGVDIAANPLGDKSHEVVLSLEVKATYQQTTAFIIELQYAAQTEFDADVSEEKVERVLLVEVPRYLFPFVRSIVVNATREGGFPPLLLNPINFRKILDNRRGQPTPGSSDGS